MINRAVQFIALMVIGSCTMLFAACSSSPSEVIVTRVVTSVAQEMVIEPTTVVVREVTATPEPTAVATETLSPTPTPELPLATDPIELAGHEAAVNSIQFSPDSQLILAASDDGTARLWDLKGNLLVTFAEHTDEVNDAIFSPDGNLIVTSSDDETVRIWSVAGEMLHVLADNDPVNSALFTPDGRFIITNAHEPKIWDIEGNLLTTLENLRAMQVRSWISPDGRFLLFSSGNGLVRLYEIGNEGQATFLADVGDAATNGGLLLYVFFLPTSEGFITLSLDLQIWGIQPDGEVQQLANPVGSPWVHDIQVLDGDIALLVDFGFGSAAIANLEDLWSPNDLILFDGHTSDISTAAFSQGNRYVITASNDHTSRLWNLEGETLLIFSGYDLPVTNVLISPDENFVITGDRDSFIQLWDISSLSDR